MCGGGGARQHNTRKSSRKQQDETPARAATSAPEVYANNVFAAALTHGRKFFTHALLNSCPCWGIKGIVFGGGGGGAKLTLGQVSRGLCYDCTLPRRVVS